MAFQNNPIAFNRLSSFRPLLELDSVSTNSFTRDVQLLMQSVAKVLLEKPSEKKAGFEKIMAFVVREPAKWEAAAVHICTSIPEVNRIAPEFFRRIANHSTDLKRARLLERSAIRRTTLTRIRSRINDSRIINSTVVLYLLIMVLSAFIKFATNTVNKPTILPTTQSMESANSQKKVLRIRWDAACHVQDYKTIFADYQLFSERFFGHRDTWEGVTVTTINLLMWSSENDIQRGCDEMIANLEVDSGLRTSLGEALARIDYLRKIAKEFHELSLRRPELKQLYSLIPAMWNEHDSYVAASAAA